MLADLFTDSGNDNLSKSSSYYSNQNKSTPPAKRKETNLAGIKNQGATCYLNTLLQTLLYTREFRENLFSLSNEELGLVPSKTGQLPKLRVIPVELQRLFAQLLLLEQEACSTNRLTDSFGWTNNEELQQHDVQELNRILFSAIEQSLVNTKQSKLIQNLYKGTYINKIKCLSCLNVFEREEEFLDLPITVQGSPNLECSLNNSFILREKLDGNNQYKCEKCNNQYRDAEKYCQLKTLPPILTLSLLRFTYDLNTYQRIKETSRFEFPFEINLKEYMEDSLKNKLKNEATSYELFSVIIHSGSAYGGHYHCYIKDFDLLGKWTLSEEITKELNNTDNLKDDIEVDEPKEIILICMDDEEETDRNKKDLVNLDYLKYDKPLDLLKAFIYNRSKYDEFKIDNICADLTRETGVSWNKRFKNKYGPIEKFLRKYDDTFEVSSDGKSVHLKHHEVKIVSSSSYNENEDEASKKKDEKPVKENSKMSDEDLAELYADHHWYDFDDSKVTPIFISKIKKQFEGKESAYMLFYRRKTHLSPSKNPSSRIQKWLLDEIQNENHNLNLKREEYENSLNNIKIECYLESDFYLEKNILNLKQQFEAKNFWLYLDKRTTTVGDLQETLVKYCTEQNESSSNSSEFTKEMQERKEKCLELLFDERSSYWLLVQGVVSSSNGRLCYYVKENPSNSSDLISKIFEKQSNLILVFSKHLDQWPIGDDFEPLRIQFKYFDKKFEIRQITYTFTKNTLIKQVKQELGTYLLNEQSDYQLGLSDEEMQNLSCQTFSFNLIRSKKTSIINQNENTTETIFLDANSYDHKTLKDMCIQNGDVITVESEDNVNELFNSDNKEVKTRTEKKVTFSNRLIKVNILNFLLSDEELKSGNIPTNELFIEESDSIKNMRIMALSSFGTQVSLDESHLRFLTDEDLSSTDFFLSNLMQSLSLESNLKNFFLPIGVLYDDSILGEVIEPVLKKFCNIDEPKLTFLLCPGRAPVHSNEEFVLKCYSDKTLGDKSTEIFVTSSQTVLELTEKVKEKLELEDLDPEEENVYYLKKLDWLGDVECVLNNFHLKCSEINFKNNQTIQITKGILIPPNHIKIKLWLCGEIKSEQMDQDYIVLNDLMETQFKDFKLIKEIIVSNELKLEDLKVMIESLLIESGQETSNFRIRLLKKIVTGDYRLDLEIKFQKKKPLIEWHKNLKQQHLAQETDLGIELLEDEDCINQGIMLLNCIRFDMKTRLCSKKSFRQIYWNINNGATLASLKDSIMKSYLDLEPSEMFRIQIAKRLFDKFQWIILRDVCGESQKGKKKKKSGNTTQQLSGKTNLKQSPFNLDDGDLIAFTIPEQSDSATAQITPQDFMSNEDLEIMNKKNITAAEISRIRKQKKYGDDDEKKAKAHRRPEIGITIKIDDFTKE
ncbi:unnamed protein product [Brachionus calyciflorus]|uniref:USP domain-containing protein n=1 Tax=Brachionus calyciflorus TaxID=104777 RepID=A0A813UJI3_9BILA|nr:unnamed protein product [Brachionus calyciflorus]